MWVQAAIALAVRHADLVAVVAVAAPGALVDRTRPAAPLSIRFIEARPGSDGAPVVPLRAWMLDAGLRDQVPEGFNGHASPDYPWVLG